MSVTPETDEGTTLGGYTNKICYLDLRRGKFIVEDTSPKIATQFIGGVGMAVRLLFEKIPNSQINPLDPRNPLVIATGPFTGTLVPTTGKFAVASKSPLTELVGFGVSGGKFGPDLKRAGFDALVIEGRSRGPVYIWIDNGNVKLRNAMFLRGKTVTETTKLIYEELGDTTVSVAAIGPAGEKMVRYSCITNDGTRQIGRTGMGAVMGSKNVKAIAVRGVKPVEVAFPEAVNKFAWNLIQRCQSDATRKYRDLGTPENVLNFNERGLLPTRNFQQTTFESAENISGETLKERFVKKIMACYECAIGCDHMALVETGQHAGASTGLDYETIFALGSCCGIGELSSIIHAAQLCDEMGIDTMSGGVTIAFAMELFERGILTITDTNGLDLRFGNAEAMIEMIKQISNGEGLGDILADGTRKAAERIGKNSLRYAMQVKGLEWPGYSPQTMTTATLGFSVSVRGACHLRNAAYGIDSKPEIDRYRFRNEPGRISQVIYNENLYSIYDSIILCKFIRNAISEEEIAYLYFNVTGHKLDEKSLLQAGERITNLEKLFNIREGAGRRDDYPPPRAFEDPAPDGPGKGEYIRREDFDSMLNEYYRERGWDQEGHPLPEKLHSLGLSWAIQETIS